MNLFKRVVSLLIVGSILIVTLSACGDSSVSEIETETIPDVPLIDSMSDLERGNFYVECDGGYASPYWGNTSFDTGSYNSTSPSEVAWFMDDDWVHIPTIYRGEKIVYRSNEEFSETFYLEKFNDIGFTIGLCNLSQTASGRYKVSTAEGSSQINPSSDAAKLNELGEVNVIIDAIAGQQLRENLISSSGTILNLEKDAVYSADIYVGTEIYTDSQISSREFKADSRALVGSQTLQISSYEFIQAEIIEIEIPEDFKTGYYSVNGTGIFRYVNDDELVTAHNEGKIITTEQLEALNYNEDCIQTSTSEIYQDPELATSEDGSVTYYPISCLTTGVYYIQMVYDLVSNEDLLPDGVTLTEYDDPAVTVKMADGTTIKFEKEGDYSLSAEVPVSVAGTIILNIEKLYGRNFVVYSKRVGDISSSEDASVAEDEKSSSATNAN